MINGGSLHYYEFFDFWYKSASVVTSNLFFSNKGLSIGGELMSRIDYVPSGLYVFHNITLDSICGDASCNMAVITMNMQGRAEFYNLTVRGFYS